MTREEFINVLDEKGYSYNIKGDSIVVTHKGGIFLNSPTSLPPYVEFNNTGAVVLYSLTSLPTGVEFNNGGGVDLDRLTSISPGVEFKNGGIVILNALTSLPPGVFFNNGVDVDLSSLIGGWISSWEGNIEGMDSKSLLNVMIKRGMFI